MYSSSIAGDASGREGRTVSAGLFTRVDTALQPSRARSDLLRRKLLDLQHRPSHQTDPASAPPIVHDVLRSPGRSLDQDTRTSMESRFGHDFGKVRVHDDARAVESAQAVDALAYTVGRDIVFATGQYAPQTPKGRRLLAHELTHAVQQTPATSAVDASTTASLRISGGRDGAETEAERVATTVTSEQPLTTPIGRRGHSVQRQEVTEEERRRWMGAGLQPEYRLHLDPEIEAMAFRMPELLDPEIIKATLSRMDFDSIVGYQPPPWVTVPPVPQPGPLVPRGAGPETPRAAGAGDVLKALMSVPAVDTALTKLKEETKGRISREGQRISTDWQSATTRGKIGQAAVLSQSAVIGAGFLTGAVAGVASNPEALRFTLDKLQDTPLPTGVPGLSFQFNVTGSDKKVRFDLNVGAFLPPSWGFRKD